MSQNPAPRATVLDLDAEKIGDVLVRLGLLSYNLGHEHVSGTLRPYCNHPENLSPEAQFVYDMIIRRPSEIIDRWYGGQSGAIAMLSVTTAHLYEPDAV
jgi:hypothetical protein